MTTFHRFPPNLKWNVVDVEIEWGFQPDAEPAVFGGRIEAYGGCVKSVKLNNNRLFDFAGGTKGSASHFAMVGGPVPAGNRLLIPSSAFLYCLGEK